MDTNKLLQVKKLIDDVKKLLNENFDYKLTDKYIDSAKIILDFEDILSKKEEKSENE